MPSTEQGDPWIDHDFDQSVRDTAYFLWEHDGRPDGMEREYWSRALDRCLRQREADKMLRKSPRELNRANDGSFQIELAQLAELRHYTVVAYTGLHEVRRAAAQVTAAVSPEDAAEPILGERLTTVGRIRDLRAQVTLDDISGGKKTVLFYRSI